MQQPLYECVTMHTCPVVLPHAVYHLCENDTQSVFDYRALFHAAAAANSLSKDYLLNPPIPAPKASITLSPPLATGVIIITVSGSRLDRDGPSGQAGDSLTLASARSSQLNPGEEKLDCSVRNGS